MKVAIYFDGVGQLVLTPENDAERAILNTVCPAAIKSELDTPEGAASIYRGGFYACRGGWVRQATERDSLIVRIRPEQATS